MGLQRRLHRDVVLRRDLGYADERVGKSGARALKLSPQRERMIDQLEIGRGAILIQDLTLERACEDRLEAAGDVSGTQADSARRGDCNEMAVAYALGGDAGPNVGGQRRDEWPLEMLIPVKGRKRSLLACQFYRCPVGGVADGFHQLRGLVARGRAAIVQTEHDQGIAEPGNAKPDPSCTAGSILLLRQRKA